MCVLHWSAKWDGNGFMDGQLRPVTWEPKLSAKNPLKTYRAWKSVLPESWVFDSHLNGLKAECMDWNQTTNPLYQKGLVCWGSIEKPPVGWEVPEGRFYQTHFIIRSVITIMCLHSQFFFVLFGGGRCACVVCGTLTMMVYYPSTSAGLGVSSFGHVHFWGWDRFSSLPFPHSNRQFFVASDHSKEWVWFHPKAESALDLLSTLQEMFGVPESVTLATTAYLQSRRQVLIWVRVCDVFWLASTWRSRWSFVSSRHQELS